MNDIAAEDPRIARGMRAQLALRHERLAAGDQSLGWKVGFGAPAAMKQLGITAPLVGFLTARARLESGARVSLAGWSKPVAEPEIAVTLRSDLAGGASREAAAAAIGGLGPAIELADLDRPPNDVEAVLAGNIFQRRVVLGPRAPWRAGVIAGLTARIIRRGVEVARTTEVEANTGALIDLVRHVAGVLAAYGERLAAGEVVIAGSVVPPLFIEPDEDGVAYELDPIGGVSVEFTTA